MVRAVSLIWCALLAACAGPLPDVHPDLDAAAAVAVADAIVLRGEVEALDVAATDGAPLTLARATWLALQHSPELQVALWQAQGALAAAKGSRRWPNPVLELTARFPASGAPVLEAGLAAEVLALLQTGARAAVADQRLFAACAEVVGAALDVAQAVQSAMVEAETRQAALPLLGARIQRAEQLVQFAAGRLQAGEGTQLELDAVDSLRLGLLVERDLMQQQVAAAELELLRLLGRPRDGAPLALAPIAEPVLPSVDLVELALQHRPELRAARAELAARLAECDLAGLSWLDGSSLAVRAERDGGWSAGPSLSLPVPLFDGGGPRQDAARAAYMAQRHRLLAAERGVVTEVRRAAADTAAQRQALQRVREQLLPLLQRRRDGASTAWRAGETDAIPVLLAEAALAEAQQQELALRAGMQQAHARLVRAVGGAGAFAAGSENTTSQAKSEEPQR